MRNARPYKPGPTGNPLVDAIGVGLRERFVKVPYEPIPERLVAIAQKLDDEQSSVRTDRSNDGN